MGGVKRTFLVVAIIAMTMAAAWTGLATAGPQVDNLVPNSSVEEAAESGLPESWLTDQWGTNDASFEYLQTGYTGTRSVQVKITDYASGDAKWCYEPQPVTAGAYYRFSDYYKSDVITNVAVALEDGAGATTYVPLKDAPASNAWARYEDGITIPAGVVSATVYHVLAKPGTLTTDEFSFGEAPAPSPFARGIVSITFDDGYATDYDTALPILQKHGLHATHYVFTNGVGDAAGGYMTADQIAALAAAGEEIGSHTVTHSRLTQLEPSEVASELANSKSILQGMVATEVASFALPYGDFDVQVVDQVRRHYRSCRTTISGYNTPYNIDPYRILVMPVDYATSLSQVQSWVDTARQEKYWLVLMYHRIDDSGGSSVRAGNLDAALAYIKGSGVEVETVREALAELEPQLAPVSVLNVVGQSQEAATTAITEAASLPLGNVTRAYSATMPAGDVISQDPAAGTSVAPGTAVDLVVSRGPEPVSVPNAVGRSEAAATTAITGAGLALGNVTRAYSATMPAGDVISQDPAAGTSVAPGTAVDLVVSRGPEPVSVPNAVGRSEAAATAAITRAGLALGNVTRAYSATMPAGDVISQDPAAGTSVAPGTAVDLVVSRGPEPPVFSTKIALSGSNSVKRNRTYKLTGTVKPSAAGGKVTVKRQRLVGKKWRGAGSTSAKISHGKFTVRFKPSTKGTWRAVVTFAGQTTTNAVYKASSATKSFKVK